MRSSEIRLRKLKLKLRDNALLTTRPPVLPPGSNRFSQSWLYRAITPWIILIASNIKEEVLFHLNAGCSTYFLQNYTTMEVFWLQQECLVKNLYRDLPHNGDEDLKSIHLCRDFIWLMLANNTSSKLSYSPLEPRFMESNAAGVDGFFQSIKILSMTSFRRDVKSWAPCRRFTVCKRTSSQN